MRRYFLIYSIWLSAICIITTVVVNVWIAQTYFEATGKRQAFFDLHAAVEYVWRYYVAIPSILALVLAFSSKGHSFRQRLIVALVGAVLFILVFAKLWRLFVWIAE